MCEASESELAAPTRPSLLDGCLPSIVQANCLSRPGERLERDPRQSDARELLLHELPGRPMDPQVVHNINVPKIAPAREDTKASTHERPRACQGLRRNAKRA